MTQFKVGDDVCVSGIKCKITRETNKFFIVNFLNEEIKFSKANYQGYGHCRTLQPIQSYYDGLPREMEKLKGQRDKFYNHYVLCYDEKIALIEKQLAQWEEKKKAESHE